MQKITSVIELRESIRLLEIKHKNEGLLLKEQFNISVESIKPINLIKNTIAELVTQPDFKADLMKTTLSLAAGFLSKKIVVGSTHNPFKQMLGTLLQMGVTSIVSKNADGIKSTVSQLISNFLSKKETQE